MSSKTIFIGNNEIIKNKRIGGYDMPTTEANESDEKNTENKKGNYGYICTNCGMG